MSSWFRGWSQDKRPPDKPECLVVCESLLMELNYQINEAILREREKDQEERRKSTGVDYSWLVTEVPKSYEIPELDKLELEELCMKIKAKECTIVITEFRKCLLQDRKPADITRLFRSVVLQVLDARPVEQSMSNWMMKSLTSLRPLSSKITPINAGMEDSRNCRSLSDINMKTFESNENMANAVNEAPKVESSIGDASERAFQRVERLEDLPV